jgi:putative ABC transport system permease protein
MNRLFQSIRHAARSLRRGPGFAAVAAATLAIGIGATTAVFATRIMQALLFEVGAANPRVLAAVAALLLAVALLASWLPARRASRVDPLTALRTE